MEETDRGSSEFGVVGGLKGNGLVGSAVNIHHGTTTDEKYR